MRGIEISFQNCDGFLKGYPFSAFSHLNYTKAANKTTSNCANFSIFRIHHNEDC